MSSKRSKKQRKAFCVFIDTLCDGSIPSVGDAAGRYWVFGTEREAQLEIVDNAMTRLQEFMDGERDYDDAITVEEYVLPVSIRSDGIIVDETGRCFGPCRE